MKVLIVGKTHKHHAACLGAITVTGRALRLLQADGNDFPGTTRIDVGQVLEVDFVERQGCRPPHVEDVLVRRWEWLRTVDSMAATLRFYIPKPWRGGPSSLFDGLVMFTQRGSGFICEEGGLPERSTGFWIPGADLRLWVKAENDCRYRYGSSRHNIKYVGFARPVPRIPAGSWVRVSLARWWRPDDAPEFGERCYLQLSGWFFE